MEIILRRKYAILEETKGEDFSDAHLHKALRKANEYATSNGTFVAPMPLLLGNFPYLFPDNDDYYKANSEDISGIDKHGKFGAKGEPVVVTLHGGKEGGGISTPDIIEKAQYMNKRGKGGLNGASILMLDDVFKGKDVLTDLLHGGMPDGTPIPVLSYGKLLSNGAPADFQRYAIVRTLELARKTNAGFNFTYLIYENGKVADSQVIVYSGDVREAQDLLERIKKSSLSKGFGLWHPFNERDFNPNETQLRLMFVGNGSISNYVSFYDDATFLVVPPKAHGREKAVPSETTLESRAQDI